MRVTSFMSTPVRALSCTAFACILFLTFKPFLLTTRFVDSTTTVPVSSAWNGVGARKLLQSVLTATFGFDSELPVPLADAHVRVPQNVSSAFPFLSIGLLDNGCTGSLVGPCHVLTAGHCVKGFRKFPSTRLGFTPGQNGEGLDPPRGKFGWVDYRLPAKWRLEGDDAFDAAIIQMEEPIGRVFGYIPIDSLSSDGLIGLNIAGYPVDMAGEMWFDYCDNVRLAQGGSTQRLASHTCKVTDGNSGSPMWTLKSDGGSRETRAMHIGQIVTELPMFGIVVSAEPMAVMLTGELQRELTSFIEEMKCY